jgi:hypothetical protein
MGDFEVICYDAFIEQIGTVPRSDVIIFKIIFDEVPV